MFADNAYIVITANFQDELLQRFNEVLNLNGSRQLAQLKSNQK
jgi:hypothetical protein